VSLLHRRLSALLALIALLAFIAGAGLDAISAVPAGVVLLLAVFVQPGERHARLLEPMWRAAAFVLAVRAALHVVGGAGDPVLPMVDLLLLLLCAESLQQRDGSGDARHFALTFALLIASAAYRPGALFGLLFIAYVVCATVVLVLGHLTRQARARHVEPPVPQPQFLLRVALLSTVVLVVSAIVFLFFPRVSRGWAVRPVPARAVVGFSDRVSLAEHGARIEANPEVVMRVEFPDAPPSDVASLHWRGRAYDRFDGWAWSRTQVAPEPPIEAARWRSLFIDQVIYARALPDASVLFGLHPIMDITPMSSIWLHRAAHGDYTYFGDVDPVYRVRSRLAPPPPAVLRAVSTNLPAPAGPPDDDAQHAIRSRPDRPALQYLQLPPLTARMRALADSFRNAATNRYDHASSIEHWLRTEYTYTLELPATRREATLDHFLFERRAGHCEYFSTALAVLLRAGGVPTRNVNGFLGGEWNAFGGFLTVTQNQAHSWVEVYFPGVGWVTFDPTPAAPVTAAASAGTRVLSPFRFLFQGVEHRWGKWILDYDLSRQSRIVKRLQRPFDPARNDRANPVDQPRWLLVLAAAALLAGILIGQRRKPWRRTPRSADTRLYLSLRRAYERAGFPAAAVLPPLAFARAVSSAPGGAAARRAVELYLQARFGARTNGAPDRVELRRQVAAARRALHRR
jgi:protein-glutamine gamma-glutamyltransferase